MDLPVYMKYEINSSLIAVNKNENKVATNFFQLMNFVFIEVIISLTLHPIIRFDD